MFLHLHLGFEADEQCSPLQLFVHFCLHFLIYVLRILLVYINILQNFHYLLLIYILVIMVVVCECCTSYINVHSILIIFRIVSNMFCNIVIVFSKSIYAKSYADIMLINPSPIFVEEVLSTIFLFLSSW